MSNNHNRLIDYFASTDSVVTSGGINDSGMFGTNLRDERLLSFDGARAVSTWRIELPPGNNQFDLETVNDFVMHLNDMAREGGDMLRRAACEATECRGNFDFLTCSRTLPTLGNDSQLAAEPEYVPFPDGHRSVKVRRLGLYFEAPGTEPSRSHVIEFLPKHHLRHKHDDDCDCELPRVTCVASSEWPCFYHGILEATLVTRRGTAIDLGLRARVQVPTHPPRDMKKGRHAYAQYENR
jgi:hypothetical protein